MADRRHETTTLPRHVDARIREALNDTRVVALVGPRQSGKTTLSRSIAADLGLSFVTLDDAQFRQFAIADPTGFIQRLDRAVIDEVQRAPELILALKRAVDEDPRPGRFLITGSVDLFRSTISPDSLAGRVETIELLPFSQAEIERRDPSLFLTRGFAASFPVLEGSCATANLIDRIVAGGYPEALTRAEPARRSAWLKAYANALAERDVTEIAGSSRTEEMSRLLDHAALLSGQTINFSTLSRSLSIDGKTVDRWLALLEHLYLVRRVGAWHRNDLKRLTKTPKLHFLDSGLLAALRHSDAVELSEERGGLGPLLEAFVFSELTKLANQELAPVTISHYRDRDQVEVDFVLERTGKTIGIEVKAGATAKPEHFRGLQRLREAVGKSFACGILLHGGERIQQVGDRLFAMPVAQLWA